MSNTTKERERAYIIGATSIGNGRVRVTFSNNNTVECNDDGSFWQWTGSVDTVQCKEDTRQSLS